MTITAFDGPVIGGIPSAPYSGMPANTNPEVGPSLFNHFLGLLDPRGVFTYIPGENFGKKTYGIMSAYLQTIDVVPSATTANNIAAAQTATAGTALTLASANTTGITVSTSITNGSTGATVTGLLAIDTASAGASFGSAGTIQIWDPRTLLARNVVITCNGTDTGTYTVAGYDVYGFPLSEVITGTTGTAAAPKTAPGKKAFKYIASVTPAGTVNSTGATVGTGDVFGFPVRVDRLAQTLVYWGNPGILQAANNTGLAQTITIGPITMSQATSTSAFRVAVPFDGFVTADLVRTMASMSNQTASFALTINGTTAGITGGVISIGAAGSSLVTGAIQTGTAITAGNSVTAGQTIGVLATSLNTTYTTGAASFEFTVYNTDLGGNSTFTAAVTTAATTTSGDVRGTFWPSVASDGTSRLTVVQFIPPSSVGTATAIFGVTQA